MLATQPWVKEYVRELPMTTQPETPKEERPVCIMLIGLPGSGKTTYCHQMLGHLPRASSDDHIERLCRQSGKTYSEGFSQYAKEAEKRMYLDVDNYTMFDMSFVWDQTNLSSLSRMKKLSRIPFNYEKRALIFREPVDLAKRLASRPGKIIPAHVIENMRAAYERPTSEEGFDLIVDVI